MVGSSQTQWAFVHGTVMEHGGFQMFIPGLEKNAEVAMFATIGYILPEYWRLGKMGTPMR